MIDLVKKFFSSNREEPHASRTDITHDIRVATCALLLEMASIDGKFTNDEKKNILSILERDYDLSREYINELIKISENELKGSIDLWQFTNLINQNYSLEEKVNVLKMVWEIAYTDGKLDCHEDYLVHKISNLFRLNHKQLIDVKLEVLNKRKIEHH